MEGLFDFCVISDNLENSCKQMILTVDSSDAFQQGIIYVKDLSLLSLSAFRNAQHPERFTLKDFTDAEELFKDLAEYVDLGESRLYIVILFEDMKLHRMILKMFGAMCDMLVNDLQSRIVLVNTNGKLASLK